MKYVNGAAGAEHALRQSICARVAGALILGVAFVGAHAQQFTATTLGSTQSATVTVTIQHPGTLTSVQVLTQGAANLDFTLDSTTTPANACVTGIYAKDDTCNVAVKFTPRYPGARQGAVVLAGAGGALGTAFLSGTGKGALEVMVPGVINTFAGNGAWIWDGDEKAANAAALFLPMGGHFDASGNFYVADSQNSRIRMVDPAGVIHTVAGNGTPGFAGDGGLAKAAALSSPSAVVVDGAGNMYISDSGNQVIRRVDAVTHNISTIAGQPQQAWFFGDGGQASSSYLDHPQGLVLDGAGNLYIADAWNNEVRRIDVNTGVISAFAGMGGVAGGYDGEGLPAAASRLFSPWGIAFGPDGSLYIADLNNNRIRKVDVATGAMTTVAGTGDPTYTGDGGPANSATVNSPGAVVLDPAGNLYVADSGNNVVRKIITSSGLIETIVGSDPIAAGGDGLPSFNGGLYAPYGLALDGRGNLYIADMFHNLVRWVNSSLVNLKYDTIRIDRTSEPKPEAIENDGNDAMTLSRLNLVRNVALDPDTDQPCSESLTMLAGSFCNLGVEFFPNVIGTGVTGQLIVETSAFNSPATINLVGDVLAVDPTKTVLTAVPLSASLGASVTFTAKVSWTTTGTVPPAGTVKFFDGTTLLGSGTLAAQVATFTTSALGLGSHSITAVYGGDDNNGISTSDIVNEVVKQPTTTAVASSSTQNTSLTGTPVTFTATVTAASGTPTGSVQFKDGASLLTTVALNSGVATYTTSALGTGQHTITVNYLGDTTNAVSTGSVTQTVKLAASVTTLGTSDDNVVFGTQITLTAQVTGNGIAPTGSVQFKDGANLLQTVSLDGSGKAVVSLASLTVGAHNLTAAYQGDAHNGTSLSSIVTETITKITTSTALATSKNPSPAGAKVTLTATVTPDETTGGTLSGSVNFKEGSTLLGTGTVNASGVATLDLTTLPVGPHTITAVYSGATNFATSTSTTALTETIDFATTTTTLSSSAEPSIAGKPVTFTATVSGDGGTPAGTVTFKDGADTIGTGTLSSGKATYIATSLQVGPHTITAVYAGDANDSGSTSAGFTEHVQQATTSVALITSLNPVIAGKQVTFTATVTGTGAQPAGSVSFRDGTTELGAGVMNPQGIATLTTSALPVGARSITAVYSGDANDATSTSPVLTENVQRATTGTSVEVTPNPVPQGAPVSMTATVIGNGAMPAGTVQFLDGATVLGTGTLNASGQASFNTTAPLFGSHNITAVYGGDPNDGGSTSPVLVLKVLPTTTVSLASNMLTAAAGAEVVFTAAVSGQASVPTGTVTFKDGAAVLGTASVDGNGRAHFSTTTLTIGGHSVTASYSGDGANAASVSSAVNEQIVQATTHTLLTSNPGTASAGAKVTLTATVSGDGGVPGGQVTFKEGANVLGTGALTQGVATLAVSTLSVATHSITAVYAGDTNDGGSTSTPVSVVVELAATSVSVTSETNPSTASIAVTLHAVVTGGAVTPSGSMVWKDGGTMIGTTGLDGTGAAALTISTLTVGAHHITASYSGDANSAESVSPVFTQTVQTATSAVVLVSSANPSLYQDAVLLTATVTGAGTMPTGTVQFLDGTVVLGTAAVDSAGMATLSSSAWTVGQHSLVASYLGDANHSVSQSLAVAQSVMQRTSTVLTSSANPAFAQSTVRLTATVTPQANLAVTGTVSFKEGSAVLGIGTVNASGVATFDTAALAVGQHQIVAVYSGDSRSQTSTSPGLSETIRSATTTVSLVSSANPSTAGAPVTFTATVASTVGGAVTGSIVFEDGSTTIGTGTLSAGGVATLTTSSLTPGLHTITAVYSGDSDNATSLSASLKESVLQITATTLVSSLNPSLTLDPVVLTATVSNGGTVAATGSVTFTSGSTVLGTASVSNGVAVLTIPSLPVGQYPTIASYGGDAADFPSKSTALNQVIRLRPTTDTLTAQSSPQGNGQQVTLISVVRWAGAVTPTGTAVFTSGTTRLGSATVDSTGVATLTVVLSNDASSVVATYSGDASYAGSTSNTAKLPGNQPTKFTLTADASAATVPGKQFTVIHLTLTSLQGYTDTLKLGCLGLPYAATCTFSTDTVSLPADGKQTVTLTIDTGSPLTAGSQAKVENAGRSPLALALLLPGGLLLGFAGWRGRKRLRGVVLLLIVGLGLTAGLTGCAGSLQINGTPAGSYAFKIAATGTDSGISQTMDFKLTVQ